MAACSLPTTQIQGSILVFNVRCTLTDITSSHMKPATKRSKRQPATYRIDITYTTGMPIWDSHSSSNLRAVDSRCSGASVQRRGMTIQTEFTFGRKTKCPLGGHSLLQIYQHSTRGNFTPLPANPFIEFPNGTIPLVGRLIYERRTHIGYRFSRVLDLKSILGDTFSLVLVLTSTRLTRQHES